MNDNIWTQVDDFIEQNLLGADSELEAALAASGAAGLPAIAVSPAQGKMLQLLARINGTERILEVGTLGGYSTIWLARALPPGGRLVTLEADPHHAEVAHDNIKRAHLAGVVDIRVGPALETLPRLLQESAGPFDLVFIDADKENNPTYVEWAVRLGRPGTVVVVDNVVRKGSVLEAASTDAQVKGTRALYDLLRRDPRFDSTVIQTVGRKGYDGFALAIIQTTTGPRRGH
jgi:predicted O-methyltransferase YrrM